MITTEQKEMILEELLKSPENRKEFLSGWELHNITKTKCFNPCPKCNSEKFFKYTPFLGGWTAGPVICDDCNYRESFMSYIGKQICHVEPLPETGALNFINYTVDEVEKFSAPIPIDKN